MIETNVKLDLNMQKALNRKRFITYVVMLVVGSVGLFAYLAISVALESGPKWLDYILWTSAVFFGFGLVFLLVLNKTNKKVEESQRVNNYVFFKDFMLITTYCKGEAISSLKQYYHEIVKVKETKDYIFLYLSSNLAYPLLKKDLKEEDKNTILSYIKSAINIKNVKNSSSN